MMADDEKRDSRPGDTVPMRTISMRLTKNLRRPIDGAQELKRAQVIADLTSLDQAIELLTSVSASVLRTVGASHDAFKSIESANERARVARAKLELVRRRIP